MTQVTRTLDVDYLVVGAGATGMAFTDALIDHADVRVALVDRRPGVGGHWLNAYPFVRLHQASLFYGVASTPLGDGRVQTEGPEAGLHERADQPAICAYYDDVLTRRMVGTGRVELFATTDYLGGRALASVVTGDRFEVPERCRIVDARYLAPEIPAETPPKFAVADGARVIPVNDLVDVEESPGQYVVVGSGKTATDAIVWLLQRGEDPDTICWVRPREPWMLNRARLQPDPVVFLGLIADVMREAAVSRSLPEMFVRLEDAGAMLRIDRSVEPTMAKAPTLGLWELELLRSIEDVVRLGHVTTVHRGRIELTGGSVEVAPDALVVSCAADGLRTPPTVPIWSPEVITLQPIRAGFPCFGAALAGYVEATRSDDAEKNRLCPPTAYGNSLAEWAAMNLRGAHSVAAFRSEPDVRDWSDALALNPARIPPAYVGSPALGAVLRQVQEHGPAGLEGLARLCESAA
jgi:hypothetical protein